MISFRAARRVLLASALAGLIAGSLPAQTADRLPDAPARSASASTPLTLGEALTEALRQAPDLAARTARLEGARASAEGAAAWMPPMIGVMADNVPAGNLDPTTGDMGIGVMVSQTIPWPGKRRPAIAAARLGAEAEAASLEAARRALVADVTTAYVRLALVEREHAVLGAQRRVLQELADLATRRYAVGGGSQADALRASLERTRIETDDAALRAAHAEATRTLRVLLGRSVARTDSLVAASPLPDVVQKLEGVYEAAAAMPEAWRQRPEFGTLEARQQAVSARLEAVSRSRRPDITVNASYSFVREGYGMDGMGMDMWSASVSFTVPIAPWSNRALEAEKAVWLAETQALAEEGRSLEQRFAAEAVGLARQVAAARDVARLYERDLLPQARTAYDAALRAYATGSGDLTGLLDAQRALLDLLRASETAQAQYAETLARAAQSLGADFAAAR